MSYVYVCIGCGCLDELDRSDRLTCSPACRVRAHRNGSLKELRAAAAEDDLRPAAFLHARAMKTLLPDRKQEMLDRMEKQTVRDRAKGSLFKDQPDIRKAFYDLLFADDEALRAGVGVANAKMYNR